MFVHFNTQKWIKPQSIYLNKFLKLPHKVFATVPKHISPTDYHYFNHVETGSNSSYDHAIKLNLLADIACAQSTCDYLLLFLDGDCFPFSSLIPLINLTRIMILFLSFVPS